MGKRKLWGSIIQQLIYNLGREEEKPNKYQGKDEMMKDSRCGRNFKYRWYKAKQNLIIEWNTAAIPG